MKNVSRFVWHDLSTTDVEGARTFYGGLFQWSFEGGGDDPYLHVKAGDRMIGGIRPKEAGEPGPPSWLGYVLVESVPSALERVAESGGQVFVPSTTLPDVGTFAVVADPTGGVVAPWRSARPEENEESTEPPANHTFCWDELLSTDPARAATFYSEVFGWGTETRDMGEMGDYTLFTRPGVIQPGCDDQVAWSSGMMKAPPGLPFSCWLAYVQVEDTDRAAERAGELGATITVPPTDIPGVGRFATFADPQGATLAILSVPGA